MKLSFFPFTPEVEQLARNRSILKDYEMSSILSFKEDKVHLNDFQARTGIPCFTSIEQALKNIDSLILLSKGCDHTWEKYYDCIDYATSHEIPVYCGEKVISSMPEEKYRSLVHLIHNESTMECPFSNDKLLEIDIPIIAIMGVGENCGKFECELELKQYIDGLGYQCLPLSSNPLGKYAGMVLFPDFLYDDSVSFPQKVLGLNRYVYELCKINTPDVLLVGVPGGIIPLSNTEANRFSEIPLVISLALHIDAGVLAVYFTDKRSYLSDLSKVCLQRYFTPIKVFYISRQSAVMDPDSKAMQFMNLSNEYISEHSAKSIEQNIATPLKNNNSVYQLIIQGLSENLETV